MFVPRPDPSHCCHVGGSSRARSRRSRSTCKTSGNSTPPKLGWFTSQRWSRRSFVCPRVPYVYRCPSLTRETASSFTSYLVGRLGTGLIMVVALVFSLPWLLALIVQSSLPLFIAAFALASKCPDGHPPVSQTYTHLWHRRNGLPINGRTRCGDAAATWRWL